VPFGVRAKLRLVVTQSSANTALVACIPDTFGEVKGALIIEPVDAPLNFASALAHAAEFALVTYVGQHED